MEPFQLEKLLSDAQDVAIKHRNYYTTREHFLYVMLDLHEVRAAFATIGVPRDFVQSQLERYFREILEVAPQIKVGDEIAVLTESLKSLIEQTLLQAISSGRQFPREIDFLIQMFNDESSYCVAVFKAIGLKSIALMRWASEHSPDQIKDLSEAALKQGELLGDDPILLGDPDKDDASDEDVDSAESDFGDFSDMSDDDDDDAEDAEEDDEANGASPNLMDGGNDAGFHLIKKYVTRLVRMARDGKIDPVVGRDREIETCCQALLRRTKCNVLILGDAGVGKTAIVEGLARRIALGDVPNDLTGAEIYSVDIPSLMAGTKFRGEMEGRLKTIIRYVKRRKNAILFIDEMHSAAGTDRSGGSQEILTLLKPELAKGRIRLIGTTTYEEFRRVLQSDSALLRRFHKLDVEEPDEETTRKIIHAISEHYADFHHVEYTDEALDSAVLLAGRYMPERRFPDKAIDVIDEAGAANRMHPLDEQLAIIDVPQIEKIVTNIARIPDLHVSKDETGQLKTAAERMKNVIFGQDQAIETVINLVKLSRAGIRVPNKPVACMLFAGPTGVGKTEVARQLASILSMPFVRFDMSEYREEYTISKFIGSAPGYVGFERGGLLTETIRAKPNCVLLLDEIEKAHPSIYDLLLQVMDVAKLTDNTGKSADFRNVILIMTSNAGGVEMNKVRIGFGHEIDVSQGMKDIERTFSPEFRNRLDDIVMFNALTPPTMVQIVSRQIRELEAQLAEKHVAIQLDDASRQWLAEHGYDPQFGARPMARLIQREISLKLADEILFGKLHDGGTANFHLNAEKSGLAFDCTDDKVEIKVNGAQDSETPA